MQGYELLMSVLVGGAVASLAWIVASLLTAPREISPTLGRFEESRRQQLRNSNVLYRCFEPWVDEILGVVQSQLSGIVKQLGHDLPAVASRVPWQPEEYLATTIIESLL